MVTEDEVGEIQDFKLTKQDNDMSRHVAMIRIKGAWWIFFDLGEKGQDNLKKARGYLTTASDFYSAAVLLSDKGLYGPLVDTLNSATELAVLAQLMISASQQFVDNNRKTYKLLSIFIY
jgi:hypothetical protein